MDSLQGQFLVAAPGLLDPNFRKSVVVIVQHSSNGALGLIVNRPTEVKMKEGWKQISDTPCESERFIYLGGPCDGLLTALHTREDASEIAVLPGLYFSAQPANIEQLVNQPDAECKFVVGYAGWAPGQLEAELKAGGWLVVPATIEDVLSSEATLWPRLVKKLAGSALVNMLNVKQVPSDPTSN